MEISRYLREEKGILLSGQQRRGIETVGGNILLLAVPGAGKTTVLTARIAHLMANLGAKPERILILTFNRESVREMGERWRRLFGDVFPVDPEFSTIHSFCLRLLHEYAQGRGTEVPQLLEGQDRLLAQLYRELTGKYITEENLSGIANAIGYCVNMRMPPSEAASFNRQTPGFSRLFSRYTSYKRENHLMDFDDMLLFADTALERSRTLRERVRERYDHILVDEAQDTSRLQHSILQKLVRDNLFMVGDEDQSIYGFRGAWPQGLVKFFETYPNGQLLKLEENYRSTKSIVAGASQVISKNRQRYQKDIFTRREEGQSVKIVQSVDLEDEYQLIASLLKEVPSEQTCAVLYRTGYTGIGLGWTLRRQGIPFYSRETRIGYSRESVTRDIENILRLSENPGSGDLFRRTYFLLGCGIPKDIAEAAIAARPKDVLKYIIDYLDYPSKNTGKLGWARRTLQKMAGKPPLTQFQAIIQDLEYLRILERRCQNGYQMNPYYQKLAVLRQFADASPDTYTFLESLQGAEKVLNSPENSNIVLSTVHSAKGKEFDRVIIADALEGIFPAADALEARAIQETGLLEEETRLFYTAMTRAKDRLVIIAPGRCLGRNLMPSRFLSGINAGIPTVGGVPLTPGLRVMHCFFGLGVLESADASRRQVQVSFRHYGRKKFAIETLGDGNIFQIM